MKDEPLDVIAWLELAEVTTMTTDAHGRRHVSVGFDPDDGKGFFIAEGRGDTLADALDMAHDDYLENFA